MRGCLCPLYLYLAESCGNKRNGYKYYDTHNNFNQLVTMIAKPCLFPYYEYSECDDGLLRHKRKDGPGPGMCTPCPEKKLIFELANWRTCKYNENYCPQKCSTDGPTYPCSKDLPCYRGMKRIYDKTRGGGCCMKNDCKTVGKCSSDKVCCDGYGCMNGEVIYAEGRECTSNTVCLGGTQCKGSTCMSTNNPINSKCDDHTGCDYGLLCENGKCSICRNETAYTHHRCTSN